MSPALAEVGARLIIPISLLYRGVRLSMNESRDAALVVIKFDQKADSGIML